jgi:hypothetical protein
VVMKEMGRKKRRSVTVKNGKWRIGFGAESMEGLVSEARRGSFGASIGDTHFPDMTVM